MAADGLARGDAGFARAFRAGEGGLGLAAADDFAAVLPAFPGRFAGAFGKDQSGESVVAEGFDPAGGARFFLTCSAARDAAAAVGNTSAVSPGRAKFSAATANSSRTRGWRKKRG